MSKAPYLFQEMNDEPRQPRRHGRRYDFSPAVQAALAGLKKTLSAIPEAEWAQRKRRWDDLQRDLKKGRVNPAEDGERKRSASLDPS